MDKILDYPNAFNLPSRKVHLQVFLNYSERSDQLCNSAVRRFLNDPFLEIQKLPF